MNTYLAHSGLQPGPRRLRRARRALTRHLALILALAAGWTPAGPLGGAEPVKSTNSPVDFPSFKIVYERNIFNPNRRAGSARGRVEVAEKPPKVDSFTLVGTLLDEGQLVAFFTGTESAYRKAVKVDKTIAGFRLAEVTYQGVKLCLSNRVVELPVGRRMTREEEGEWQLAIGSLASVSSGSSEKEKTTEDKSTGDAAVDAILKKLMEKREKE